MSELSASKIRILLCAAQVTVAHGAGHLTLDKVAEAADLSKGGLLYHYPSKRALLQGMLQYVLSQAAGRISSHRASLADQPRPTAEAMILAAAEENDSERAMSQALLAAAAEDPKLLDPAREVVRDWLSEVSAEGSLATLLMLATEGLRFLNMLSLLPEQKDTRDQLYRVLLAAVRDTQQSNTL